METNSVVANGALGNVLSGRKPGEGDCWNHIGVSGDQSCPELETFIHCRNCHVFAAAARTFFDRPAPEGYLAGWSRWLTGSAEQGAHSKGNSDDENDAQFHVATVGILTVEPLASNIVPGRCRLIIDARTTDPAFTERFMDIIDRESMAHAAAARVARAPFTLLSEGLPVACDTNLRTSLRQGARELGLSEADLPKIKGIFWHNNITAFAPMLPVTVSIDAPIDENAARHSSAQQNATLLGSPPCSPQIPILRPSRAPRPSATACRINSPTPRRSST